MNPKTVLSRKEIFGFLILFKAVFDSSLHPISFSCLFLKLPNHRMHSWTEGERRQWNQQMHEIQRLRKEVERLRQEIEEGKSW